LIKRYYIPGIVGIVGGIARRGDHSCGTLHATPFKYEVPYRLYTKNMTDLYLNDATTVHGAVGNVEAPAIFINKKNKKIGQDNRFLKGFYKMITCLLCDCLF
jgi:hypothetical protein